MLLIFLKFTQAPHEAVPITVPSVQMRKLRLLEERLLATRACNEEVSDRLCPGPQVSGVRARALNHWTPACPEG